jgi:hypothetical protein
MITLGKSTCRKCGQPIHSIPVQKRGGVDIDYEWIHDNPALAYQADGNGNAKNFHFAEPK